MGSNGCNDLLPVLGPRERRSRWQVAIGSGLSANP